MSSRPALVLAVFFVAAGLVSDAAAQGFGLPGLNVRDPSMNGWEVDSLMHSDVTVQDLKRAYRGAIKDLEKGNCRSAGNRLDLVLDHIDNDADVFYAAATARRCTKQFRLASELYEAALELDETIYPAYRFLGVSYLALGELEDASNQLGLLETKRLECEPTCDEALVSAATSLRAALEFARSIAQEADEADS